MEEDDEEKTKNEENVEKKKEEMYTSNGNNLPYYHYYQYQHSNYPTSNNYLSTYASTSSSLAEKPKNAGNYSNQKEKKEENDYSNVPAAIIIQLEKANRTIAAQNVEIDRLRSFQNQNLDTTMLKKQIFELEKEMRGSRDRFLEQQELLSEMSREMDNLLRDKLRMQASLQEMEKKYRKAKYATKELARILENDTSSKYNLDGGFESEDDDNEGFENTSLFQRSRQLSNQQMNKEIKTKAERIIEQSEERKKKDIQSKERELMEKVLSDNEMLLIELEKEKQLSESIQDDLQKTRTMILDRDEQIIDLKSKLGKAEKETKQVEQDLSRTSSDLALERARCDALTLELHELDAIFAQTQSTVQAFAIENEQLDEKCRDAHHTIISLNAKLEAQGNDLVQTKKALRNMSASRISP